MKVIWTTHAKSRQREWERKLRITKQEVEDLVNNPGQIVSGDIDVLIANQNIVVVY